MVPLTHLEAMTRMSSSRLTGSPVGSTRTVRGFTLQCGRDTTSSILILLKVDPELSPRSR
jgi:hypothetical protein